MKTTMKVAGKYFYGHEISAYGQKHGYVDYYTLSRAFDAVLNNDIMQQTEAAGLGYWEQESGQPDNSNEINEKEAQIEELEAQIDEGTTEEQEAEINEQIENLRAEIEALEEEENEYPECYQYFIVSDPGAEILKEAGEVVFYNSAINMYIWGVTHLGTSWEYVLTDIRCNTGYDNEL